MKKAMILCAAACCLCCANAAPADEITDQVKQGLEQYEKGNLGQAVTEIDFALGQIRQKHSELVAAMLPEAPEGWKADKAKANSQEIMGTGAMASRAYGQDGGKGRVKVEVLKLGQGLGAMFNPMMMQKMGGGKPVLINGMKGSMAIKGDNAAEATLTLGPEHILKVDVSRVDDPESVAKRFVTLLDLKKLQQVIQ